MRGRSWQPQTGIDLFSGMTYQWESGLGFPTWSLALFMLGLICVYGLGTTLGYHRMLTHRAVERLTVLTGARTSSGCPCSPLVTATITITICSPMRCVPDLAKFGYGLGPESSDGGKGAKVRNGPFHTGQVAEKTERVSATRFTPTQINPNPRMKQ